MKRNITALFLFFLVFSSIKATATGQLPDRLIYKGDTLYIFTNPLEQLYENDALQPVFFDSEYRCINTGCWRGYIADWIVTDRQLYLTGLTSCCYIEDSLKADLHKLFGDKCVDGKVKAGWFTGEVIAPKGKLLYYVHMGYSSLYEKELALQFREGKLMSKKTYSNSGSKQSVYSQDKDKRDEFIYSHIKWESLPEQTEEEAIVYVRFSANENGIVDSAAIIKGHNPVFDQEALRVIMTLPEWDVFSRHGKHERESWTLPIFFSEAKRNKYQKKR